MTLMSTMIKISIDRIRTRESNEEFFDQAWELNIERYRISDNVIIFCDPLQAAESFLIEISFPMTKGLKSSDFKKVNHSLDLITFILQSTEVDAYQDRNKLFLRKLLF